MISRAIRHRDRDGHKGVAGIGGTAGDLTAVAAGERSRDIAASELGVLHGVLRIRHRVRPLLSNAYNVVALREQLEIAHANDREHDERDEYLEQRQAFFHFGVPGHRTTSSGNPVVTELCQNEIAIARGVMRGVDQSWIHCALFGSSTRTFQLVISGERNVTRTASARPSGVAASSRPCGPGAMWISQL